MSIENKIWRLKRMYAHYDKATGEKQKLENHLFNVAEHASEVAKIINQPNVLFLIGLYHDLGKSDQNFQDMMMNQKNTLVNHSSAGAKYLFTKMLQIIPLKIKDKKKLKYLPFFIESISYVISSHHGVYDIPIDEDTYFNSRLYERMAYDSDPKYKFDTDVLTFADLLEKQLTNIYQLTLTELILSAFNEYIYLHDQLQPNDKSEEFYYNGLIIRLYLSILKNADILDTINAYSNKISPLKNDYKQQLAEQYVASIESLYQRFGNPTTPLNKIRTSIAQAAKDRGEQDTAGIYRLDLPTGAGKTNLSIRYAVHQMAKMGKERFIYITPYLSVLEQNAREIKAILGEEGILEHHSNIIDSNQDNIEEIGDKKEASFHSYLTETWDSPVVLSTMVQIFQTFFKVKSSNIRRFANLINSTIVLDEVQSLPVEVTTLFNLTMNFLSKVMNVNVVLCTATQPNYDSKAISHPIQYGGSSSEETDIVQLKESEREVFNRTSVYKFREDNNPATIEDIAEEVLIHDDESILIILNTKAAVKKLYEQLKQQISRACYHLSTNMCAKHRLDIIEEIREKIHKEPLICISTQLIEAGVDLDFNRVIRSNAGIDSIVQASGRCNREGKLEKGIVQLVNVDSSEEKLDKLKSIKDKKQVTEQIITKYDSPINISELNDEFFERYYSNNRKETFDYPTGKDLPTVYNYLSLNSLTFDLKNAAIKQSFKTAAHEMDLIKDDTQGVIVYYNNKELIEDLIATVNRFEIDYYMEDLARIRHLLKQLQPYTVNMYRINDLKEAVTSYMDGEIKILQEDFYDNDGLGVQIHLDGFIL